MPLSALLLAVAGELFGVVQTLLLLMWGAFLLLALFPGGNPARPRLFFAVSVLWALGMLVTLAVLVQSMLPVAVFPPSLWDVLQTIPLPLVALEAALYFALIVTLWRRSPAFRPLIVVGTLWGVADDILNRGDMSRNGLGGWISALALSVSLRVAVALYLILHFRVRRAAPRGGDAFPRGPMGSDAATR